MTARVESLRAGEVERLRDLAGIGASWAATALAQLMGRTVITGVPRLHGDNASREPGEWRTGVLFEIEGELGGLVALLLPTAASDRLVRIVVGEADPPASVVESALREVGNIVVSQAISSIADALGGRILVSVPSLVMDDAERELASRISGRGRGGVGRRIDSELHDRRGELRALVVLAADAAP